MTTKELCELLMDIDPSGDKDVLISMNGIAYDLSEPIELANCYEGKITDGTDCVLIDANP